MNACNNMPDNTSQNVHYDVDLIPSFTDIMRIIPCTQITGVVVEHTLIHRRCFTYTQNLFLKKDRPYVATHTLATTEDNHLETDCTQ
jgi:hypothetical protein